MSEESDTHFLLVKCNIAVRNSVGEAAFDSSRVFEKKLDEAAAMALLHALFGGLSREARVVRDTPSRLIVLFGVGLSWLVSHGFDIDPESAQYANQLFRIHFIKIRDSPLFDAAKHRLRLSIIDTGS